MEFIKDLLGLLRERKKFWLIPALVILVTFGFLAVVVGSSAIAPFLYTIF